VCVPVKRFGQPLLALTFCAGLLAAQQIKTAPVESTPAGDGKQMFGAYCAVCHGGRGKGDGPAAEALKKRPADLTQLTRKNNGVFPELKVARFIKGDDVVAAHGTRDMPVWGGLFGALSPNDKEVVDLRVATLEAYIKSLQAH
jgi:mono/diheme cytochrome c family protein